MSGRNQSQAPPVFVRRERPAKTEGKDNRHELGRQAPEVHATALGCLLLAVWFGLLTGYLELITNVVKCNLIDPRYYNASQHFLWMFPAAGVMVLGMAALPLCLLVLLRPRLVSLSIATGWLSFFAHASFLMRLPFFTVPCLVLAMGLACQTARFVAARPLLLQMFVRRSLFGLLGLLVLLIGFCVGRKTLREERGQVHATAASHGPWNVLLVVLDTARAANMSLYGYERDTTPNLARLAAQGVRFEHAISTAPWTTPSHASLFTGRWPHELSAGWKEPLDSSYPTLAEFLRTRGYLTAGFVANTYYCSYETGLNRGFAHYEDYDVTPRTIMLCSALVQRVLTFVRFRLGRWGLGDGVAQPSSNRKTATRINRDFLSWLDHQPGKRFFAFLNYYDAHHPFLVPEPRTRPFGLQPRSRADYLMLRSWWDSDKLKLSADDIELARDCYDDCLAYLDEQLGDLFDELQQRHVLDDTLLIITADHGEHLGEQKLFGHGCSLYQPELHVPLLIVAPRKVPAGQSVRAPVSLRDIPATVLDLLDMRAQTPFPGRSLAQYWNTNAADAENSTSPALSEIDEPNEADPNQRRSPVCRGPMRSLVSAGMHYIRNGDGSEELYDCENDPAEEHDLGRTAACHTELDRLRESLDQISRDPESRPVR